MNNKKLEKIKSKVTQLLQRNPLGLTAEAIDWKLGIKDIRKTRTMLKDMGLEPDMGGAYIAQADIAVLDIAIASTLINTVSKRNHIATVDMLVDCIKVSHKYSDKNGYKFCDDYYLDKKHEQRLSTFKQLSALVQYAQKFQKMERAA